MMISVEIAPARREPAAPAPAPESTTTIKEEDERGEEEAAATAPTSSGGGSIGGATSPAPSFDDDEEEEYEEDAEVELFVGATARMANKTASASEGEKEAAPPKTAAEDGASGPLNVVAEVVAVANPGTEEEKGENCGTSTSPELVAVAAVAVAVAAAAATLISSTSKTLSPHRSAGVDALLLSAQSSSPVTPVVPWATPRRFQRMRKVSFKSAHRANTVGWAAKQTA